MIKKIFSNNTHIIKNYFYLSLVQGTNFIIPLITYPYLVRTLDVKNYGIVMMAGSLMVFLNIFVDFGFNISATREVSLLRNKKDNLSRYYWNVFFTKFILIVLAFIILLIVTSVVPKLETHQKIYLYSFGIVIGNNIFPAWFFQGIEKMKIITLMNVLAKVTFLILIFLFVKKPSHYVIVPVLNSLGFIVSGVLGLLLSLKYVHFVLPKAKIMKHFIYENRSLIISNFATSIYTSGNTFILGLISGENIAGVYSSMEKLVMAIKTIYTPLYQAIFPWLSTNTKQQIINYIRVLIKPVSLSGILLVIFIFLFADKILDFIYDNKTIVAYSNVFRILGLIAFFSALNMMYVSLMFPALKKYNYRMIPMVLGGIINLILAVIGAYYFGIYGVAVAAVLAEFSILIFAYFYSVKLQHE